MKVTFASAAAICIATCLVGSTTAATAAIRERGQDQMSQDKMGKTPIKDVSYTGCVELGQTPHTYVLTHVKPSDDRMGKDAMAKDAMSKTATKPSSLAIVSQDVDLSAHVGQKVTVSGTAGTTDAMKKDPMSKDAMSKDAMAKDAMNTGTHAFNVKTITTVASSCQ